MLLHHEAYKWPTALKVPNKSEEEKCAISFSE
jgi:hypothetical protein